MTKSTIGCCHCCCLARLAAKPFTQPTSGFGQVSSNFQSKRSRLLSQDWILYVSTLVRQFELQRRRQNDPPPNLFTKYYPSGLFSFPKDDVRAGWPFAFPIELQDKLWWGSPNHHNPTSSPMPVGDGWTATKSTSELTVTRPLKSAKKWWSF